MKNEHETYDYLICKTISLSFYTDKKSMTAFKYCFYLPMQISHASPSKESRSTKEIIQIFGTNVKILQLEDTSQIAIRRETY